MPQGDLLGWGELSNYLYGKVKVFVHRTARLALDAGLAPVIVVTGAEAGIVKRAVSDLLVRVANNPVWQTGQGSSVCSGMQAFDGNTGAVIFLLADQPQVPVTLLHALVDEHAQSMAPIIAPLVDGQRVIRYYLIKSPSRIY